MTDFKKEFKNQTKGFWWAIAVCAPVMLVVSVLLAYASVPFYLNIIVCVIVGLFVFFIFHLFYDRIQKKKEEKKKANKGKDPFAD